MLLLVVDQVVEERLLDERRAAVLQLLSQLDGLALDLVVLLDLVPDQRQVLWLEL